MSLADRYVVAGLAPARSAWFAELARAATSGALPVEFVKCISVDELHTRLASGRTYSAVLVDAAVHELDRDLVDAARAAGCAVVVVDDERTRRDWSALGVHAVIGRELSRSELLDVLASSGTPVRLADRAPAMAPTTPGPGGQLVAVTGPAGTGRSTIAMALAQGLARRGRTTVLADFALDADQAALHGTGDVIPGLPELVDAARTGAIHPLALDDLTFAIEARSYDLLLGLRRRRDWVALRPRAVGAAVAALRDRYDAVVVDVDDDTDGLAETGSADLEDRNVLARTALARADAVVVVSRAGVQGTSALVRSVVSLLAFGIDPRRVQVVVNHSPRSARQRAELRRAISTLVHAACRVELAEPVFIGTRSGVERAARDARRLPDAMAQPLARAVVAVEERRVRPLLLPVSEPVRIAPGSLGLGDDLDGDAGDGDVHGAA